MSKSDESRLPLGWGYAADGGEIERVMNQHDVIYSTLPDANFSNKQTTQASISGPQLQPKTNLARS